MRLSLTKIIGLVLVSVFTTLLGMNLFVNSEKRVRESVRHEYGVADPQFARAMSALLGPPLVGGNRTETLINGDRIFPSMLAAIRGARRTINFETYIYWSGKVGRDFADALSERARAGVKVNVLIDWVGSQKMEAPLLEQMQAAGVRIHKYHPLHWYTLDRLNNRTHRKFLVVDGLVGFTGGVGIADEWSGDAQDPGHWRDTHFRVEGPVVAQMQAAFLDNWMKVTGEAPHGEEYFPELAPAGGEAAQVFRSSPEGGSESMALMYLISIASARESVDLAMAYFVPDALALDTLLAALQRGVRVRILMPGPITDAKPVRRASRALWGAMLAAGAEIHEYQPTMFHCKVLVVDGLWVSVGSTNFDPRSFRLNDEANLNVYDREFARRQVDDFERDLKRARRITHEEWLARPWHEKLWERFLSLFRGQL